MFMQFKQLTLSLCIFGLSAASFAQTTLVKSKQNVEEYKLDNGFRVVLAPNDKENKIFINTIYLTGSLNDPQGKSGLAHLLEHYTFKGTQNVKGRRIPTPFRSIYVNDECEHGLLFNQIHQYCPSRKNSTRSSAVP